MGAASAADIACPVEALHLLGTAPNPVLLLAAFPHLILRALASGDDSTDPGRQSTVVASDLRASAAGALWGLLCEGHAVNEPRQSEDNSLRGQVTHTSDQLALCGPSRAWRSARSTTNPEKATDLYQRLTRACPSASD